MIVVWAPIEALTPPKMQTRMSKSSISHQVTLTNFVKAISIDRHRTYAKVAGTRTVREAAVEQDELVEFFACNLGLNDSSVLQIMLKLWGAVLYPVS